MFKASHPSGNKKKTSLVRPPGNLQYREGVGDPARSLDNYDEKDERGEKDEKKEKDEEGVSQLILRHLIIMKKMKEV